MYINFNFLMSSELSPDKVAYLVALKQQKLEYLEKYPELLEELDQEGLVSYIKAKRKDDSKFLRARVSDFGKQVLEELDSVEVSEDTIRMFSWLSEYYLKLGKSIGNGAKTKRHIERFSQETGIFKNNLALLCKEFLLDEENMNFNNVLEYAFYKAPTAFETKFNINESRLYKYYKTRESHFKNIFVE